MAEPLLSTAAGSNAVVQAAQPDHRDTIFCEIQNVDGFLWQICQVLADNTDPFLHILVLPDRSERFDGWGGDFFLVGRISELQLARSARSVDRSGPIEGLLEKERVLRRFLEGFRSSLVASSDATYQNAPHFFFPSSGSVYLSRGGSSLVIPVGMKGCFDGFRQISLRVRFAGSFIVGGITSNGSQRAKERLKSTFPISMAEMVCVDLSLRREPRGRMNRRQQR